MNGFVGMGMVNMNMSNKAMDAIFGDEDKKICKKCNMEIQKDSKFCSNCGSEVE